MKINAAPSSPRADTAGENSIPIPISICYFFTPGKSRPTSEAVTERLLYTLWDAGLQVGHATRTVKESIALSASDMKVKTALLDARYLCGNYELYQEFEKAVESRLVKKRVNRFVQEKLTENRLRHESYGGSVYLLEPDVKDGEGGLRDIHTARWIGRVKAGAKDLDALALRANRQCRRCRQTENAPRTFCCGCATSCIFRRANTRTS